MCLQDIYVKIKGSDNLSIFIGVVGPEDREVHTMTITQTCFLIESQVFTIYSLNALLALKFIFLRRL